MRVYRHEWRPLILDLKGYGGQLIEGAEMTLLVSAVSLVFGIVVGFLGAGAKLSRWRALRLLADIYTTVIRGIPELIIILLLYFGGTVTLTALAGHYVEVNGFGAGVFALTIVFGAYATEVFRGAVLAIPRGQTEGARALGMKGVAVFWTVMLPQLWRFALPGLGNLWLVLLKDSALISVVGLEELLRKTAITAGATRQPFTFYFAAAMIYLGFTVISATVLHWAERRAARGLQSA